MASRVSATKFRLINDQLCNLTFDRFPFSLALFDSTFLKSMQECIENTTKLGPLIKYWQNNLHVMYVKYCQNKPVSEHIIAEHLDYFKDIQMKLKHRLGVSYSTRCVAAHFCQFLINFFIFGTK